MMKLLLLGDTHGDIEWIRWCYDWCAANKVDAMFQLGDFGYWNNNFLNKITKCFDQTGIPFYWLDGNHENYTMMKRFDYTRLDGNFITCRPGVFYSPRSHTWEWENIRFMSMGGAYSIDRGWRTIGESWFTEEEITETDIENACSKGTVNVLLSHDVPESANIDSEFARRMMHFVLSHQSQAHRIYLEQIAASIQPQYVFHGHYHLRYSKSVKTLWGEPYQSTGLAASYSHEESLLLLTLNNGEISMDINEEIHQ